jgi:hypothetical protein
MDPDACLRSAQIALNDQDYELFSELIDSYEAWRRNGGFDPTLEIKGDVLLVLLKLACGRLSRNL